MPCKDMKKRLALNRAWAKRTGYWKKHNAERAEALSLWGKERRMKRTPEEMQAHRDYLRKYNTGWAADEYQAAFEEQHGCCAICGRHQSEFKEALSADHNHSTKQKRGLLCNYCNPALGAFLESPEILAKAIEYVKFWKEK